MQADRPAAHPARRLALAVVLVVAAALAALAAAGAVVWADLLPPEREALASIAAARGPLLALLVIAGAALVATGVRAAFVRYPLALVKLAEQVRVIRSVNASHAPGAGDAMEVRQLAAAIAELAQAYAAVQQEVDARVADANARLAQEKNQLAVLVAGMAQSVVVCNRDGSVLLYNPHAARLLAAGPGLPLGLGRSVFGVLDRAPLLHALGQVVARLQSGTAEPVAHFVTTHGDQLLRVQMAAVPDGAGGMAGFVLILEDITRRVESVSRRDRLLQQLTEGSRAALANMRAAAETLQAYPDMDAARRMRFLDAIHEEAQTLSAQLQTAAAARDTDMPAAWPREDISASDLLAALRREVGDAVGLDWDEAAAAPRWLSVDSYALVQALAWLARRLAQAMQLPRLAVRIEGDPRWVRLQFAWQGPALDGATLHEWEEAPLELGAAAAGTTLQQVLEQHGGGMWRAPGAAGERRLCLQLPAAQAGQAHDMPPPAPGRPVYYDFDLFSQSGSSSALDDRPLAELACTVFDTEATGPSPSEGDEIIAIGAVHVLNGKLLAYESFDRLVRPLRPVRSEAQAVHGISQEMLADQPALENVLPQFHRFAQDTVLVGHNAAFDMRLLQLAEVRTGVAFDQPVLDTLLLSALVHPGHPDAEHRLEAIAARLGVPVVGRHTALGDALLAAEVFVRLIPLLAARDIRTLRQAREASQTTFYARLEY